MFAGCDEEKYDKYGRVLRLSTTSRFREPNVSVPRCAPSPSSYRRSGLDEFQTGKYGIIGELISDWISR
jgi:hypothetical protein